MDKPSPAARACRDAMRCVFAFLTLTELVHAARCCVQWDKWSIQLAGRTETVKTKARHLRALSTSRMLPYVTSVVSTDHTCGEYEMNHLRHSQTITSMTLSNYCTGNCSGPVEAYQLPPSVTKLRITTDGRCNRLIDCIHGAVALRALELDVNHGSNMSQLRIEHLVGQLHTLVNLERLKLSDAVYLAYGLVYNIQQISSLRSLSVCNGNFSDPIYFEALCAPPFKCIERIAMHNTDMTTDHVACLQHLPTLTELRPRSITSEALGALHRYLPPFCTNLRIAPALLEHITLSMLDNVDLSRMKTLELHHMDLRSGAGEHLLNVRLSSLTKLSLHSCMYGDLSRLRMPALQQLHISDIWNKRENELRTQLTGMPSLETFTYGFIYKGAQ